MACGYPIIAKTANIPREQACRVQVDGFENSKDINSRRMSHTLRSVRRKPGVEQLGSLVDGVLVPALEKSGRTKANNQGDTSSSTASGSATFSLPRGQEAYTGCLEWHRTELERQRARWESTLPRTLSDYISYFTSGRGGADHVDCGRTWRATPKDGFLLKQSRTPSM